MSILSTMTIGECVISTEIATFSSISATLSSKQDVLADAQISAIDQVVSSRATEMVFDDDTVSVFNWAGWIDDGNMFNAGLQDAGGNWVKNPIAIKFGNAVTIIGETTFQDCQSLTSIAIPDSVKRFGDGAFNKCASLNSIIIPSSVISIGENAFFGCHSLTSLVFKSKSKEQVEAMPNYPWGINNTSIISTWNNASQEMVDSKLSGYVQTSAFGELQTRVTSLESIVDQANTTLEEIV